MEENKNLNIEETKKEEVSINNKGDNFDKIITESQETSTKKKNIFKYLIYFFIVIAITGVVLYVSLTQTISEDDSTKVYEKIPYFINTMNVGFLFLFIGVILLVFLLNSFIMFLYAKMYQKHYKYHQALAIQAIDNFYSSITPGAYGGEIAKVFVFKQQGLEISNAASMMVMNFIVYQTALIIIGFIALICRFNVIMNIPAFPISITINGEKLSDIPFFIFIILGFLLNVITIVLLFLMSTSRRLHNFVINHVVNFLGKIKLVKDVEKRKEKLRLQVENYRIELRRLRSNILFTIVLFIVTFTSNIIGSTYPFFAGLTLNGFEGEVDIDYFSKLLDCVFFSNFHQMVTGLVPIPGTAGISEYVFDRLFGSSGNYFGSYFYSIGGGNFLVVFWRLVTFYIPFMINGIVAATYRSRGVKLKDRVIMPIYNRRDTMTLTMDTLDARKLDLENKLIEKEKKKGEKDKINK